jgi:ABC-2 type transport system permease protein
MNQFFAFVRKEFAHVMRDKKTLLILFGIPVIQILIFGFALTNEIRNARIIILDHAHDGASDALIRSIEGSRFFEISSFARNPGDILEAFQSGTARVALILPSGMERQLEHQHHARVRIVTDASDPNTANILVHYLSSLIRDYQSELQGAAIKPLTIKPEIRMLYNPQLKGAHNFVPGVIALVLMLVCVLMTAISIVREKETGTMEVLLVSPFRPALVIISKTIPYLLLSLVNLASIVLLSIFLLDLPVNGSILLLFGESTLYIITCLTIGVFISVRVKTQQIAMVISLLGMLLPTILLSGFIFPIENMPGALQAVSNIVPARWFYIIVKSIMIKGLGFVSIWKETAILAGMTVVLLGLSIKSFKVRLST